MFKNNKLKIFISSVVTLLPILFGVIMWNNLPDVMTTHFGIDGNADGFSSKVFAVFGLPLIFIILHFLCLFLTSLDKKQKEQNQKALGIIFWIIPFISVFINAVMYRAAFGKEIDLELILPLIFGVMFVFMGNYLPKVKRNSTLGIKVSWALKNDENWNKTHRFGGKVWVIGGIIILLCVFLPFEISFVTLICVTLLCVILPAVYSYLIYKQHKKEGIEYNLTSKSQSDKIFSAISAVVVPLILIGVVVIMFTGNINVNCGETSFEINATYYTDITVDYSEIDTAQYRNDFDVGIRTNGFGSAKLLMGIFQNEELGSYTLYSYTNAKEFVVLTSDEKTLVIGLSDSKNTKTVYDTISAKIK